MQERSGHLNGSSVGMSGSLAPPHACHECISVHARTTATTTASVQGCDLPRCEMAAWKTCAGTSGQQCSYGMHELSWMCVVQILIEAPGKTPFRLTRLGGAPHGQPALALRQVQVHLCTAHMACKHVSAWLPSAPAWHAGHVSMATQLVHLQTQ